MTFLSISEAVVCLEKGMFGGAIKRPVPVKIVKKIWPALSVGFGPQKEAAAAIIHAAVVAGELIVYVRAHPAIGGRCPLQVPIGVLSRLITVRGGLPDYAVRLSTTLLRDGVVSGELFSALSGSPMLLARSEFWAWYERQKRKSRWPSQRESKKPRSGRPTKITDELRNRIKALVAEGQWSAPDSVAKLVGLLAAAGNPNRNLVRRAIQQLHEETGDDAYNIRVRKRRKAAPRNKDLVQKSDRSHSV